MQKIIAIGALGGSGTRVFADVLQTAGVFIGDNLNESLDNLLFSRLFKDPAWLKGVSQRGKNRRIQIFTKLMQGEPLNTFEKLVFRNAIKSNKTYPSSKEEIKALSHGYAKVAKEKPGGTWGWKEPNTHILAKDFLSALPHLHYVHVLRHGLDMAFSENKQQLFNWGSISNIPVSGSETQEQLAVKQLDFWMESTKAILRLKETYPDRIQIFTLEAFYTKPHREIIRLLTFAGVLVDEKLVERLAEIPKQPASSGRYTQNDLSIFRPDQLAFVQEMGFEV